MLSASRVGPHHERVVCVSGSKQLLETKAFLEAFTTTYPEERACYGDDLATTCISCGLVLIAVAKSGTRNPVDLAFVTGFLEEFIAAVLEVMDEAELWAEHRYRSLLDTVTACADDPLAIMDAVDSTMEGFWGFPSSTTVWLELTRARRLFGGEVQPWVDEEFREEYIGIEKRSIPFRYPK